jgi:hypothetical protein
MDREPDRQRADREPRGFLPRSGGAPRPWRRVMDWLFGDRADIDQEGLLAERTLMMAPRRPRRDEPDADTRAPDEPGDPSA